MPTQADLDAANVYTSIMEEAKFRALSINTLSGYALPVPLQREYCFLQLRMLCELIALGCLVLRPLDSVTKLVSGPLACELPLDGNPVAIHTTIPGPSLLAQASDVSDSAFA
jgi:hypothetical protein